MIKMRTKLMLVGLLAAAILLPLGTANAAQVGNASWYALRSTTASGERMNPNALTAAHRTLPFGTKVRVKICTTAARLSYGSTIAAPLSAAGSSTSPRLLPRRSA